MCKNTGEEKNQVVRKEKGNQEQSVCEKVEEVDSEERDEFEPIITERSYPFCNNLIGIVMYEKCYAMREKEIDETRFLKVSGLLRLDHLNEMEQEKL